MLTLAIQPDRQLLMSGRYQSFSTRWVERGAQAGVATKLLNVYEGELLSQLRGCDGFLWWFAHLPATRRAGCRIVLAVGHGLGIPTFPNYQTVWHFDDKVAQKYLLDAAGLPTPRTWVFWTRDQALAFSRTGSYPLVMKLAGGIASENVGRVSDAVEAEYWIHQLFTTGLSALHGWPRRPPRLKRARKRLAAAVRVLRGREAYPVGDRTELQRGCVLFQEFLPGNDFDTRVTVIGDRAFAFRRFNRSGDFRASGSGKIDWDPASINPGAVRLAFEAARRLGTQSLAVDVLKGGDGTLVLSEISYYYEGWAVGACPGHWRPDGTWRMGAVDPEDAILDDFLLTLGRGPTQAPGDQPA